GPDAGHERAAGPAPPPPARRTEVGGAPSGSGGADDGTRGIGWPGRSGGRGILPALPVHSGPASDAAELGTADVPALALRAHAGPAAAAQRPRRAHVRRYGLGRARPVLHAGAHARRARRTLGFQL